ncbi:hypothetical protein ACI2KH_06140 [Roseomonas mucosa]|uniref:hypothetical protein n=1 Tax=Roseomonas mucosa TaxID=207340 RepID=UPI00384FE808
MDPETTSLLVGLAALLAVVIVLSVLVPRSFACQRLAQEAQRAARELRRLGAQTAADRLERRVRAVKLEEQEDSRW